MTKNNNLVVTPKLEQSMKVKSLKDLVRVQDTGNVNLLLDCSTSMGAKMRNGKTRIDNLREIVKNVMAKKPVPMIAFGPTFGRPEVAPRDPDVFNPYEDDAPKDSYGYNPTPLKVVDYVDSIPDASGGTPLAEAIDFARQHGVGRLLLISDGAPNDPKAAMASARAFGGKIDVVYVGDPGDFGSFFLDDLAKMTGGQRFEGDLAEMKEMTGTVIGLLTGDVMEEVDEDDDDDEDDLDDDDEDDDDDEEDEA